MYPETMTIDGVTYQVNVDFNSDDEIQYFHIQDADGNILIECDWEGGFSEDDVLSLME